MKYIKLTKGMRASVDNEDHLLLNKYKWFAQKGRYTYYANRTELKNGKIVLILMHRFILGLTNNKIGVDHKDRNGLNNQKNNLRMATHSQNGYNRKKMKNKKSYYKGVVCRANGKFGSVIKQDGKSFWLGTFISEKEAALAYNKAAIELHREFAFINKIN